MLAGLGLVGLEQVELLPVAYPGAWFLSILLLAAVAVPVGIIIYRIDQFEPEPASLIVIALLWGGVVALSFAAIVNSSFLDFFQGLLPADQVNSWGASLVAPIDEEFYKGAGLVMIFLIARKEIDGLMDGLVYGAMIGLGFQVMENVQYFVHAAARVRRRAGGGHRHVLHPGAGRRALQPHAVHRAPRVRLRVLHHAPGTVTWAQAGGDLRRSSSWPPGRRTSCGTRRGSTRWPQGGVGAFIVSLVIKGLPFLALLVMMVVLARRRETQAFSRLMAEEVGGDVVTQEEFQVLRSGRRRRKVVRRSSSRRGLRGEATGQAPDAGADEPGAVPQQGRHCPATRPSRPSATRSGR